MANILVPLHFVKFSSLELTKGMSASVTRRDIHGMFYHPVLAYSNPAWIKRWPCCGRCIVRKPCAVSLRMALPPFDKVVRRYDVGRDSRQMRNMRKLKVGLTLVSEPFWASRYSSSHMSVQVIVSPTLKRCAWIIWMMTINFYHFIKHASCKSKKLVAKMISKDQKHLLHISQCVIDLGAPLTSRMPSRYW